MGFNALNAVQAVNEEKIDERRLDKNQYIMTLLQEAIRTRSMSSEQVFDIQVKMVEIVKEMIMRYTKGGSTSVTVEVTESLFNSLLYTLDFYLLRLDNPEKALVEVSNKGIREIYEEGFKLLQLGIIDTKRLFEKMKKARLKLPLEPYNLLWDDAIPNFLEKYDMVFEAHNTMASIDYPLAFDDMRVRGISYIRNYLEHLEIETEFCRFFQEEDIKRVIMGFCRMCRLNYSIELVNIFELVISNSIFSCMCGNSAGKLDITRGQYRALLYKLQKLDQSDAGILIDKSVESIFTELAIIDSPLVDYINNYKEMLKRRFFNALENNSLSSMIVLEEEEKEELPNHFDEGSGMRFEEFKSTIDEIMSLTGIDGKIEVVKHKVHSMSDFIDILNADCFFGDEFLSLFCTLEDIELAVLIKSAFFEELRDNKAGLSELIETIEQPDIEWKEYLIKYIAGLSQQYRNSVEGLLRKVDFRENEFY